MPNLDLDFTSFLLDDVVVVDDDDSFDRKLYLVGLQMEPCTRLIKVVISLEYCLSVNEGFV